MIELPPEPWHGVECREVDGRVTLRIAPTTVASVQGAIQRGQRRMAARLARDLAAKASDADLKALVLVLADAVEAIAAPKPSRRPTKEEQEREHHENGKLAQFLLPTWERAMAQRLLLTMLIAADLADEKRNKRVGPRTLSRMMSLQGICFDDEPDLPSDELADWRAAKLADPAIADEAREHFRPIAAALLKAEKLDKFIKKTDRRGWRDRFRQQIASARDIPESLLKCVTVKTSE